VEANSTGGQGSRRAVAPSDDDDMQGFSSYRDNTKTDVARSVHLYLTPCVSHASPIVPSLTSLPQQHLARSKHNDVLRPVQNGQNQGRCVTQSYVFRQQTERQKILDRMSADCPNSVFMPLCM
jgi:hypothetical protein